MRKIQVSIHSKTATFRDKVKKIVCILNKIESYMKKLHKKNIELYRTYFRQEFSKLWHYLATVL